MLLLITGLKATQTGTALPATVAVSAFAGEPTAFGPPTETSARIIFDISISQTVTARLAGYSTLPPDGKKHRYMVQLFTPNGTLVSYLDKAKVTGITEDLNAPGSATFTMPIMNDKIGLIKTPDSEVQIWRGPDLMFEGVVTRGRVNGDLVEFQCQGLAWYFTKRVVGTEETNYVSNGDFEFGADSWGINNYGALEPAANRNPALYTAEIRTDRVISGTKALYQECGPVPIWGGIAVQSFIWDVDASEDPDGDEWSIIAWCYIPGNRWSGPRVQAYTSLSGVSASGLLVLRTSTTEFVPITAPGVPTKLLGKDIETLLAPITEDTPRDTWIRIEVPMLQPVSDDPERLTVILAPPIGGIYWDRVSFVRTEKLYYRRVDQAKIAEGLVEHAQDTTIGKSDLRIGTDCENTGVLRDRTYYYYEHEQISDTIDEWPQLFDGFDWSIVSTATTRTFITHYPQRGSFKPKQALILGKNISQALVSVDGEQTANLIMVLADGTESPGREEAIRSDPAALTDGLTLEKVFNATPGSSINTLQAQANRGVMRYRYPVTIPSVTTYADMDSEDSLIGMVSPGDILPVTVKRGWIDLNDDYRVISMTLNPQTEQITFTLNPWANWDIENFQDV